MRRFTLLVLSLTLASGSALAQKVYIDYDPDYDASKVKTFSWSETSDTSLAQSNPLMHTRIVNGIEYYLTRSGLRQVDAAPDVWVTYHTSSEEELSFDTSYFGYGYPSHWGYYGSPYPYAYGYGYGGYGATTTTVRKYQRGTLIVDIWDASTDKLIWRGMADNITITDDPGKMEKRLEKTLRKMADKWTSIKKKRAKQASKGR